MLDLSLALSSTTELTLGLQYMACLAQQAYDSQYILSLAQLSGAIAAGPQSLTQLEQAS